MNCARNYENMLNFVKVMPKILLVPFFSGHDVRLLFNADVLFVVFPYGDDVVKLRNVMLLLL